MNPEGRKKLRAHVGALRGMVPIFEIEHNIEGSPVVALMGTLGRIESDFPGLIPIFDRGSYLSHSVDGDEYYKAAGVRAHILAVIPMLEGELGDLEMRGSGASLGDIVAIAKEALAEGNDAAKNVAAVLAAAAFEDTIRRMGDALAAVVGRPDLKDVIASLKHAGVLQGAPLTTALGYLKFRNDALHADWQKLDRAVVGSCLAFVEGLLLERFS